MTPKAKRTTRQRYVLAARAAGELAFFNGVRTCPYSAGSERADAWEAGRQAIAAERQPTGGAMRRTRLYWNTGWSWQQRALSGLERG